MKKVMSHLNAEFIHYCVPSSITNYINLISIITIYCYK